MQKFPATLLAGSEGSERLKWTLDTVLKGFIMMGQSLV